MVSGLSYNEVLRIVHPSRKKYKDVSVKFLDLHNILTTLNINYELISPIDPKKLDKPALIHLTNGPWGLRWGNVNHLAVWNHKTKEIYDPIGIITRDTVLYEAGAFVFFKLTNN